MCSSNRVMCIQKREHERTIPYVQPTEMLQLRSFFTFWLHYISQLNSYKATNKQSNHGCFKFVWIHKNVHIYAWAPAGVGKGALAPRGHLPPLEKCKKKAAFASVTTFWSTQKKNKIFSSFYACAPKRGNSSDSRSKMSLDRFYEFKIYLNALRPELCPGSQELYTASPHLPAFWDDGMHGRK